MDKFRSQQRGKGRIRGRGGGSSVLLTNTEEYNDAFQEALENNVDIQVWISTDLWKNIVTCKCVPRRPTLWRYGPAKQRRKNNLLRM